MTADYPMLVLAEYKRLKKEGTLPLDLSTRAKIRKACLRTFEDRYEKQDDDIFAEFFDLDKIGVDFYQVFKKSVADDFKALHNHIAGNNKTDETNIENTDLLAWLIDFQPRPAINYYRQIREGKLYVQQTDILDNGKKVEEPLVNENEESIDLIEIGGKKDNVVTIVKTIKENEKKEAYSTVQRLSIFNKKIILYSFLSILTIAVVSWLIFRHQCMYWTGDHFETTSCAIKLENTQVIPLDKYRLENLRRLDQIDTITYKSIGKIWYAKPTVDSIDFYTSGGENPLDNRKVLKPITKYIIDKYIHRLKVDSAGKD